jgi:hypothetical protein
LRTSMSKTRTRRSSSRRPTSRGKISTT